ncbi:MAG: glycosyltransferase family 9 protein [Phycisphaerales bacterium]|nr:MAG: glycosyltransferase family 9 protein [Phycisphaerales bacterium]
MPNAPKNILIIKPSSLGDIVLALPALTALRKSFPNAATTWLVRPTFAQLLENHPHLDQIIPFDRELLGRAWFDPSALGALISLISRLRRARFDLLFDFQGLFRTASLAWLSACPKRFGMAHAREFAHLFYSQKVPREPHRIHLVDYYLDIIRAAGAAALEAEFILPHNPAAADSVAALLRADDVAPDSYAVLVPGSAHSDKCWPVERFAALAARIASDFSLAIVATGTKAESHNVEKLAGLAPVPVANLAGRTSLAELIELMRNARLVVTNDTGPGHIAAALGVPMVMIFGRSNPARVAPYQRPDCIAAIDPDRRGDKPDSTDPKHHIALITLDHVLQKARSQLSTK